MKLERPMYLNLLTMYFPVTAIVSITHRITGVIIFLSLPLYLWMLDTSLASMRGFEEVRDLLANKGFLFLFWVFSAAWIFHACSGVRHMVMDLGYLESMRKGRITSYISLITASVLSIMMGVWLW